MKSIEQLAVEAADSWGRAIVFDDHFKLFAERFHTLAIAEEHKRLLEGIPSHVDGYHAGKECVYYTADQMAAAVLRERERCLDCYSPDDTVSDYQDKIRNQK